MEYNYNNVIVDKSKALAISIVGVCQYLQQDKREYILSKQLLRSGTSVGANVREGVHGYSKLDFYAKMGIALKEANETEYWLELLHETDYLADRQFQPVYDVCKDCHNILAAIVKHKDEIQ